MFVLRQSFDLTMLPAHSHVAGPKHVLLKCTYVVCLPLYTVAVAVLYLLLYVVLLGKKLLLGKLHGSFMEASSWKEVSS